MKTGRSEVCMRLNIYVCEKGIFMKQMGVGVHGALENVYLVCGSIRPSVTHSHYLSNWPYYHSTERVNISFI